MNQLDPQDLFSLTGRTVVVTGAGRGLGAAQVRLLARLGAHVHALDLHHDPDPETAPGFETDPGLVHRHHLDVTDAAGWASFVAGLGPVHGFVANAGVTWRARLLDLDPEDLHRVMDVNVAGALLGLRALTPLMPVGGSVVLLGSAAAVTGHYPAAYTASKWALRGLAKVAVNELGPKGIRVNTVHPGYIETPMTGSAPEVFRAANLAETPLGRLGGVDDVAPLVAFLLGACSGYVSGAEIPVDGGMTAHGGVKSISDAMRSAAPAAAPAATPAVAPAPAPAWVGPAGGPATDGSAG